MMDLLQEIWAGMKHNKLRTILTGLSVSWGIFILIILLGAGNGLKNGVQSNFSERATNTVQMWPGQTSVPYKGYKSGRQLKFSEKELTQLNREVAEMDDKTAIVDKNLTFSYGMEYGNYRVNGVTPAYGEIFNLEISKGRFINDLDIKEKKKVIVVDQKIVETLFKNEDPLGKYIKVDNMMCQVIGVNGKKERWGGSQSYIPFTTSQMIYNPDKKFYSIAMTVNGLDTEEKNDNFNVKLKKVISQTLVYDPEDTQALWIRNSQKDFLQTMKIFDGITMFVGLIGIFCLIAGIVGVSNIMLVTVKERTREIGIRKAIGAQPRQIISSIIIESVILTALFGYIGMMMGIGLSELVNYLMEQSAAADPNGMQVFKNPTVDLTYVYLSTAILIVSGVIAGYLPARKAVKINPIEAMHHE